MTFTSRRLASPFVTVVASLAFVAAACSSASSSVSTSAPATPGATPTPAATPTTAPATAAPTPTPIASPVSSAAASPVGSTAACAPLPPALTLPSDRFTGVQVVPGDTTDSVRFVFGDPSLPGPATPPTGLLTVAKPPYTKAGSGAKIAVQGEHVLQLTFTGMSLQNDAGQPTYDGPTDIKQALPAFRHAALYDASEGVIGWYIGYNGDGCVGLIQDGDSLLLTIQQR
jgi:hypothetical protein